MCAALALLPAPTGALARPHAPLHFGFRSGRAALRRGCFTLQQRVRRHDTQVFPPAPASAQVGAVPSLEPRVYVPMAFFPISLP
jgi:hypothetical protein